MAGRQVSAIKIKALRYADVLKSAPTLDGLKQAFTAASKIDNSHQGTFTYEETEPTVNQYKNDLTGQVYRSDMEPGDVTIRFTIGQYDFKTKADLQGGTSTDTQWARGKAAQHYKCFYAITEDNVCIVFPKGNVIGTGASTDNAVGIAMQVIPQEINSDIASEYWFDVEDLNITVD